MTEETSAARVWNYLLGGRQYHLPIDRDRAEAMLRVYPDASYLARECRAFLTRAVTYLATDVGIRQFIDLGCGLPVPSPFRNVHEVVQRVHPAGRVVYVDSDRTVCARAAELLTPASPQGVCHFIDADVRNLDAILPRAREVLDFADPVGVILSGVLAAIEYDEALAVVRELRAAVPSGSHLVFNDGADTGNRRTAVEPLEQRPESRTDIYHLRTPEQMSSYFEGLEMIEPGLVTDPEWRPDTSQVDNLRPVDARACVVRFG